jgi:CheY-like chemotaxis protein
MTTPAKKILVVDDEPDARDYLTTVLADHGYPYDTAADGEEAMAKIEADPPALIALDVSMPQKSGVGVYRALKDDDRFKDIPVIFITGVTDEFEKFISSRRQVPPPEGYISKPVDHAEFVTMIEKLLAPETASS